ncbi:MAG: KpsF/GutQ family sugar-phosphate isomerase [Gammaproteobacteria bacterium]|nr:KpsF/GutQ family sugar-phosphate isomerase [Gammaproteobacteria bacterium]
MTKFNQIDALKLARKVISSEVTAINNLKRSIGKDLFLFCKEIHKCKGKLVIIGVGKSGHIARKLSATFSSTGSPSFFMHPSEALHGDVGAVTKKDLILIISNSGCTSEILPLLPNFKKTGCKILSLCGNNNSKIFEESHISINIGVKKEACPINLAPTSSTTTTLVMGDVIAAILIKMKNFSSTDFGKNHPGGRLGKNLNLKVKDIMKKGKDIPIVKIQKKLKDALIEMTKKNLGCVIIANEKNKAIGFFTDGDLRRCINNLLDIHETVIKNTMTKKFISCKESDYALDILEIMNKKKINSLPVLNNKEQIVGAINMHILIDSGIS